MELHNLASIMWNGLKLMDSKVVLIFTKNYWLRTLLRTSFDHWSCQSPEKSENASIVEHLRCLNVTSKIVSARNTDQSIVVCALEKTWNIVSQQEVKFSHSGRFRLFTNVYFLNRFRKEIESVNKLSGQRIPLSVRLGNYQRGRVLVARYLKNTENMYALSGKT